MAEIITYNTVFKAKVEELQKAQETLRKIIKTVDDLGEGASLRFSKMNKELNTYMKKGDKLLRDSMKEADALGAMDDIHDLRLSAQEEYKRGLEDIQKLLLQENDKYREINRSIDNNERNLKDTNKAIKDNAKEYGKVKRVLESLGKDMDKIGVEKEQAEYTKQTREELKKLVTEEEKFQSLKDKERDKTKELTGAEKTYLRQYRQANKEMRGNRKQNIELAINELDLRKKSSSIVFKQSALEKERARLQKVIAQQEKKKGDYAKKSLKDAKELTQETENYIKELQRVEDELRNISKQENIREARPEELPKTPRRKAVTDDKGKGFVTSAARVTLYYAALRTLQNVARRTIQTIGELDEAMTTVAMVTTLNREEAWNLLGAYQSLAKEVGTTTSEIAKLSIYFFRQGKSAKEALELTRVAAEAAKVAGIDAVESANYLTSAVNGFNLAASQAVEVADKFSALAATAAVSYEEMAKALSKVAPAAKVAGVEIDYMMGFIAKGIETTREAPENIGTAFKTIFARMRELSDIGKTVEDGMDVNRVEKALASIGVALRDNVTGEFRPLQEVLVETGKKWDSLTSIQQAYVGTALAGTRQQARLIALFEDFDRTLELVEESQSAAGAMSAQHAEYMEGMQAALTSLNNAWQKLLTTITESEIIVGIFNGMATALNGFADALGAAGEPGVLMVGVLTTMGTAMVLLNTKTIQNTAATVANTIAKMANFVASKGLAKSILTETNVQKLNTLSKQENGVATLWLIAKKGLEMVAEKMLSKTKLQGIAINYQYAISLSGITLGLSVLIPLIIGLISGFTQYNKKLDETKDRTENAINPLRDLWTILKGWFSIITSTVKAFFNIGKQIGNIIAKAGRFGKVIEVLVNIMFPFIAVLDMSAKLITFVADTMDKVAKAFETTEDKAKRTSEEIEKLNAEMYEMRKSSKDLKALVSRFTELDEKVIKTEQDLEEMQNILEELDEYDAEIDLVREVDGEKIIDVKAIEEQLEKDQEAIDKKQQEMFDKIKENMRRGGEEIKKDPILQDAAEAYASSFIDEVDSNKQAVSDSTKDFVKTAMEGLDISQFESEYIYDEYGYVVDYKSYEEKLNESVDELTTITNGYFDELTKMENDALLDSNKNRLSDRIEAFEQYIEEVRLVNEDFAENILEQNQELSAWLELKDEGIDINLAESLGLDAESTYELFEVAGIKTRRMLEDITAQLEDVPEGEQFQVLTQVLKKYNLGAEDTIEIQQLLIDSLGGKAIKESITNLQSLQGEYESVAKAKAAFEKGALDPNEILELTEKYGSGVLKVLRGEETINALLVQRREDTRENLLTTIDSLKAQKAVATENTYIIDSQIAAYELILEQFDVMTNRAHTLKEVIADVGTTQSLWQTGIDKNIAGLEEITELYGIINAFAGQIAIDTVSENIAKDAAKIAASFQELGITFEDVFTDGLYDADKVAGLADDTKDAFNEWYDINQEVLDDLLENQQEFNKLIDTQAKIINKRYKDEKEQVKDLYSERIEALKTENDERKKSVQYAEDMRKKDEEMLDIYRSIASLERAGTEDIAGQEELLQERKRQLEAEKEQAIRDRILEEEIAAQEQELNDELMRIEQENTEALNQLTSTIEQMIPSFQELAENEAELEQFAADNMENVQADYIGDLRDELRYNQEQLATALEGAKSEDAMAARWSAQAANFFGQEVIRLQDELRGAEGRTVNVNDINIQITGDMSEEEVLALIYKAFEEGGVS